jgi:glycerophosphoryl diester phosphodiesterase
VRMPSAKARPARIGLLLAALLCLTMVAASPTSAQETGAQSQEPRAAVADGTATAAQAAAVPTGITPVVGDFDGDSQSDVFMYGPGSLPDHVWLGRADRNFRGASASVGRNYVPLVGDFNGNGRADIFWYGPGANPDVLWYGGLDGTFSGYAVSVGGTYEPLLGDFNGDGEGDIFWYGPGAANDVLWYGKASGGFSGYAISVAGTYQPLVADYNGDGRRDILWYGPGTGYDVTWYGRSDGTFGAAATTVNGTYQPYVGDYGGDGPNDIFWYAAGGPDDILWFGHTNRVFTSRATTLDIGYTRSVALRPDAMTSRYNPYGFVAHALGAIDNRGYTNSLEAFQRNYGRGFKVFEVDLVRLADGTALAAHNGLEANYGLNKSFRDATWADLAGKKYLGQYTIMRSQNLVGLLRSHPDVHLILDSKWERLEIYKTFLAQAPERSVRERIIPHIEDRAELDSFRTAYPLQNFMLALYHTQAQNRYEDPIAGDFTTRYRAPAVMMWWKDRDMSISLAANGQQSRRYRPSFAASLKGAGANVYVHSLGDSGAIQSFWDRNIGVYSDDPFPPLGANLRTTQEPLIMPEFPPGVIPA